MKILGIKSPARYFWRILQIISLLIVPFSSAAAGSILTVQDGYAGSYFVGAANWTDFTAKLNTAS